MSQTLFRPPGAVRCRTSRHVLMLVAGGIVWVGCASPPQAAHPVNMRCLLVQGSATDTVTIGITGTVRSLRNARGATDAEHLLFRHLYETLIEVDCSGQVQPSLAASWRRERGGVDWVFELREGANFADGAAVTAGHQDAAWGGRPGSAISAVIDSVTAIGERELRVTLQRPFASVPRLFADPALAVRADRGGRRSLPLGTRGYAAQVVTDMEAVLVPVAAMEGDDLAVIRLVVGAQDLRDLVDVGADLIVTRERGVVEYARSSSDYRSIPLPWSRLYGLLMGTDSTEGAAWREAAAALSADLAGRDWRPPQERFWWEEPGECTGSESESSRAARLSNRIVYPSEDQRARDLAERLVALRPVVPAPGADFGPVAAVGLSDTEFERALALGSERGYILELATSVLDACMAAFDVSQSAPWIGTRDVGRAIIPLAETRFTAIVRDGAGPFVLAWDGLPFFSAVMGGSR